MSYDTIIDQTAAKVCQGKVILFPTDTIWGIGCDASNENAVSKIYEIKGRKSNKPFLILVNSIEMLKDYVEEIHPRVETLLSYHKRPLTLIYEKAKNLPQIAYSQDGSIAIRIAIDDFCRQLITSIGRPIISTSANKSDEPAPKFFSEISYELKEQVDHIVDYRRDDLVEREPSILARFDENGELTVLRE